MSKTAFDLSKIKGIAFDVDGVLSPSTVPLGDDGVPRRLANTKDGFALREATRKGMKIAIISGAVAPGLRERFAMLGIDDVYLGAGKKIDIFKSWMAERGLKPEETAFAGDDVPDCTSMQLAGLGVAPADASVDAMEAADYISPVAGGCGVARDIIEQILRSRGEWPSDASANG